MQTNLDDLRAKGYVEFWRVVPENLRRRCVEELNRNPEEFWYWTGPLAEEFREWFRAFLLQSVPEVFGEATLGVFNRNRFAMDWHEDSSGGNVNYGRRVFCNCYLTFTGPDRGALRISKGSHFNGFMENSSKTLSVPDGSVIVGDERLWHAVCENAAPERRTMVMWWRWIPIEK